MPPKYDRQPEKTVTGSLCRVACKERPRRRGGTVSAIKKRGVFPRRDGELEASRAQTLRSNYNRQPANRYRLAVPYYTVARPRQRGAPCQLRKIGVFPPSGGELDASIYYTYKPVASPSSVNLCRITANTDNRSPDPARCACRITHTYDVKEGGHPCHHHAS